MSDESRSDRTYRDVLAETGSGRRVLGVRFEEWFEEAETDAPGEPVPIRELVAIQVGTALVAAAS